MVIIKAIMLLKMVIVVTALGYEYINSAIQKGIDDNEKLYKVYISGSNFRFGQLAIKDSQKLFVSERSIHSPLINRSKYNEMRSYGITQNQRHVIFSL